jgi:GntR family transcriptional regulator
MIIRSNIPLHQQIKDDILSKIKDSTFKHGEKIPSERALAEHYGVSRVTIRNTTNDLVYLGVLSRKHGSGTYVKETSIEPQLVRMTSAAEELEKLGMKLEIEVLSTMYKAPDKSIRKILQLDKGDQVYRIVRRLFADGEPLSVSYIHTHIEVGRKLENINMNKVAFLAVLEDFGYQIQYAEEKIHAVRANEFELKVLEIDSCNPVLCIERTVFISQDKPLYVVKDLYNGDRYSLNIVLPRRISLESK